MGQQCLLPPDKALMTIATNFLPLSTQFCRSIRRRLNAASKVQWSNGHSFLRAGARLIGLRIGRNTRSTRKALLSESVDR